MPSRALVIDANILVLAVLGKRVRGVIEAYAENVSFFVPEVVFAEAEEHLPALVIKRGNDPGQALAFLHTLGRLVEMIGSEVYGEFEAEARERLGQRDPEDWPILAAALAHVTADGLGESAAAVWRQIQAGEQQHSQFRG
jgi:predicted nucleic acid-binding protein